MNTNGSIPYISDAEHERIANHLFLGMIGVFFLLTGLAYLLTDGRERVRKLFSCIGERNNEWTRIHKVKDRETVV